MEYIILCNAFYDLCKKAKIEAYRNLSKQPPEFWDAFDAMCRRLQVEPQELAAVLNSESSLNPKAVNYRADPKTGKPALDQFGKKIPQAKGISQFIKSTLLGLGASPDVWDRFETMSAIDQLFWVEKYFAKSGVKGLKRGDLYLKNFGGFNNPDGSLYASKAHQDKHPEIVYKNPGYQEIAYQQNKGLDKNPTKGYISKDDLLKLIS
jgi:hypothetical protein